MTLAPLPLHAQPLRVGVFDVDATPPVGSPLAYDPTKGAENSLRCRGLVLLGAGEPIVIAAVDWIGIGNESHDVFRAALAEAAGTQPQRIAVHALHQHDAPWADFTADQIMRNVGMTDAPFDSAFARKVIARAAEAVAQAKQAAKPVTHLGLGQATVQRVASNRRILGTDGRVEHIRWTATRDPIVRAFPEGVIDPLLRLIVFYENDKPIAALTFYATHPQSYYRTGLANVDFPGLARDAMQAESGVPHVHFNGAGGNLGAGKYNDGSPEHRPALASRMQEAMQAAWQSVRRTPIAAKDVAYESVPVALPISTQWDEASLQRDLAASGASQPARVAAATRLAFLRRTQAGHKIDIGCLSMGTSRVLFMPGELFVEYQLAAQQLRPDLFVTMAAYGDYGPAYIGTEISYSQGGYENGPTATYVAPQVEQVLLQAIRKLLKAEDRPLEPLGVKAAEQEVQRAKSR